MKLLKNGRVFFQGELRRLDLKFDSKIREMGEHLRGGEEIDCSGKIILPGVIDSHVHFRDFNQSHKETWETGSRAAVKGGVTTVLEMPNNEPPIVSSEMLSKKREIAERNSATNYGLYFGVGRDNLGEIRKVADRVKAYKVFMAKSTGSLKLTDRGKLLEVFKEVSKTGKVLAVHVEDPEINSHFEGKLSGKGDPVTHVESRPAISEDIAIATATELADRFGVKLHCLHVTNGRSLEVLRKAKERGIDVTAETCPHYLYLTKEALRKKGSLVKVNPPLRNKNDQRALIQAINSGLIDTIGSDHAPHTLKEKRSESPPAGVPGVETLVPLLLNLVNKEKITLKRFVDLLAKNPAKRFGLADKGSIETGKDADFTVVDLEEEQKVERKELKTKCGWSPYEGKKLKGWPVMTLIGGRKMID